MKALIIEDEKAALRNLKRQLTVVAPDMLIIGGTSLVVYPAAGFIDYFRGKNLVVINKDTTAREVGASLTIHEPIGEVLSKICC